MRISDWSSDVCFSDLHRRSRLHPYSKVPSDVRPEESHHRDRRFGGDPARLPVLHREAEAGPAARAAGDRTGAEGGDRAGRHRADRVWRPAATADPRSEEHTSELQSLIRISYAVFCLKKKNTQS